MTEPLCECHEEPMYVSPSGRKVCRVKQREYHLRYNHSAKGRARDHRYAISDKNKLVQERYADSEKGRATSRREVLRRTVRAREVRLEAIEKELSHSVLPQEDRG